MKLLLNFGNLGSFPREAGGRSSWPLLCGPAAGLIGFPYGNGLSLRSESVFLVGVINLTR